jgi:hypothetical protein
MLTGTAVSDMGFDDSLYKLQLDTPVTEKIAIPCLGSECLLRPLNFKKMVLLFDHIFIEMRSWVLLNCMISQYIKNVQYQRVLAENNINPDPYRRPLHSDPYATLNAQGTFRWKTLEFYAGCENIFNYRQPDPIISADNPFGQYFDLSSVWEPTRGRELYLGVRYSIK